MQGDGSGGSVGFGACALATVAMIVANVTSKRTDKALFRIAFLLLNKDPDRALYVFEQDLRISAGARRSSVIVMRLGGQNV